ncbi:uncharacterized protein FTOL_01861 [Fusarium torulosum]|uniref:Uncharacterized protein n=1 Tax=Fusarium torulosum TaxID=33205 RepID=A0AAE8SDS9_9HYPO|nr:uncharacterized protein FTOL_01861 [Fusarium torulosum]
MAKYRPILPAQAASTEGSRPLYLPLNQMSEYYCGMSPQEVQVRRATTTFCTSSVGLNGRHQSVESAGVPVVMPNTGEGASILSFFFHGRGSELQKTPLGLFRSLLHQLLDQVSEALIGLVAIFQ